RSHVVLAEDLEQARSREPHERGHLDQTERQGRQDRMPYARAKIGLAPVLAEARRREQVKDLGEEQDQHDAEPEARERHTEERDRRAERVPDRAATDRRQHAERNGDGDRQREGAERELDRRPEAIEEQRGDRIAGLERAAEVAAQRTAGPPKVLQRERTIEAEPLADLRSGLLRELAADQHR